MSLTSKDIKPILWGGIAASIFYILFSNKKTGEPSIIRKIFSIKKSEEKELIDKALGLK